MPVAGGRKLESFRRDLKSCPGGYVVLRRMSYGEQMLRKSKLGKTTVTSEGGGKRNRPGSDKFTAEMQMMNEEVTFLEFAKSIVEHNLTLLRNPEDPTSEYPIDFTNPEHVRQLDRPVGEEIDDLITELNDYETDDTGK